MFIRTAANKAEKTYSAEESRIIFKKKSVTKKSNICALKQRIIKCILLSSLCPQWESRVTQYERDFDRIGTTVRKEVLRFEVSLVMLSHSHLDNLLPTRYMISQQMCSENMSQRVGASTQQQTRANQQRVLLDFIHNQNPASPERHIFTFTFDICRAERAKAGRRATIGWSTSVM